MITVIKLFVRAIDFFAVLWYNERPIMNPKGKNMKKTVSAVLVLCLSIILLAACGKPQKKATDGLSVVTTIFPTYDFARNIVGENGEVTLLLKPGEESHSYEPTPQDILKIRSCDVFVYVGGESDTWVENVLKSSGNEKMQVVTLMDCVKPIEEERREGMDGGDDDGETEYDEHIWTSPKNSALMTEKIAEAVIAADPARSEEYRSNADEYVKKLNALDAKLTDIAENSERKLLIFADRFPFLYFVREYGLEYYAAFPGCSEESEASAATVAFLINKVRDNKLPYVMTIEMSAGKIADSICAETGCEKLTLHSCNNISRDEYENGETYLSIMEKNVETLKSALGYRG